MASTPGSLILKLLGAFLPTVHALRALPLVKVPWEERPVAQTAAKSCLLTPTHPDDFHHAKSLLMQVFAKAQDTVPIFVATSSEQEAEEWKAFASARGARLPPQTVLSLEGLLKAGTDGDRAWATNFSRTLEKIDSADKRGCQLGTGKGRGIGAVKKLYGARHLGQAYGCDFVWVMDCDSQPLRNFSFTEAFSRIGKIWIGDADELSNARGRGDLVAGLAANKRRSTACTANAQMISKQLLSARVRVLDLRQNDFWIYETRLLSRLMDQSLRSGGVHNDGWDYKWSSPGTSFLDAWVGSGQVSEFIFWSSWLVQNLFDGKLKSWTKVPYKIVTVPQTSVSLARVFSPDGNASWAPKGENLLAEAQQTKSFSWQAFGKYWYETLGQVGIWGDYLDKYPLGPQQLKEFVASVPWCLSNCHAGKVQKQLTSLAGLVASF